jgi:hypothetical protein
MKDIDVLKVARHMFEHNHAEDANGDALDYYWEEPGVKQFWLGQAEAVLSFIGFAGPA